MRAKSLAASALALALASVGWGACSSHAARTAPDASAGAAANGGASEGGGSGAAGAGFTGGSAGAGGASGGTAGAGGAAWGAAPDWQPTSMVVTGCTIERLVNAPQVRFFKWEPCSWSPSDCEQAVFNTDLVGSNPGFVGLGSTVEDDGTTVRVGLKFQSAGYEALFATEDGAGLVGIRAALSSQCELDSASIQGNRFGVAEHRRVSQASNTYGAVLGDLSGPNRSQIGVTMTDAPSFGIAQLDRLGKTRWAWWWASYGYSTVSALDGSDLTFFAKMGGPDNFVYLGPPVTTGNLFLFDAFVGDDAGLAHGKIFSSDGVAPPKVYLEPAAPDTYYGRPIYANSYVAFFKGIGFQDINRYTSVELWASPYSDDPAQLKPVKIADMPYTGMPGEPAGGWGYAAIGGPSQDKAVWLWDLASGTQHTYPLPASHTLNAFLGVTRTHVWVGAAIRGYPLCPYLMRMRLP